MSTKNRARIEAYIGASGSGKGVSINARLRELQPARLLIWDPRAEYGEHARPVHRLADLVRAVVAAGPGGGFRLRYVPGAAVDLDKPFALVCRLAFAAGNLVFLAEELSDVTQPSYAPPAWRQVITQGRHKGLHVLGAAQRPTLIDKTFLANCTRVRCGALGYADDRRRMAMELDAPAELVESLQSADVPGGGVRLSMLERDRQARTLEAVTVEISRAGRMRETRKPAGLAPTLRKPGGRG